MTRRRLSTGMQNSEDRLYKMIGERLLPGANKEEIDQRIWNLFGEEWCIMCTDLAGFSRRVEEFGIIHFLQTIYESERVLLPIVEDFEGFLLKTEGDSMMVIFRKPERALACAQTMMHALALYNQDKSEAERILLCVGLGFGTMLRVGNTEVFGREVNAASKLGEDMAKQGDILVTQAFKEQTHHLPHLQFAPLDRCPAGTSAAFRIVFA